eukprot:8428713-Pyramimonas_sp.AAC.1
MATDCGLQTGRCKDLCEDLGVPCIPVAPEEQHQHGKVERVAGCQIAQTMSRLSNNKGFSPAQWVLGESPSVPASLGDLNNSPVIAGQVSDGSLMWHRLRLQEACEIAFHLAANGASLRRAVLSPVSYTHLTLPTILLV